MATVLICPNPGCKSENTARFCNRCGADLGILKCPGCEFENQVEKLAEFSGACEQCGAVLIGLTFLVCSEGSPEVDPGKVVADGRFLVRQRESMRHYVVMDLAPYIKRMAAPIVDGSAASVQRRFSGLLGLPSLLDVVTDKGGISYLHLSMPGDTKGNLFPPLEDRWAPASSARRLEWLYAWARLAIAMTAAGWPGTALALENLRVAPDGELRAIEIRESGQSAPAEALGKLWQELVGSSPDHAVARLASRLIEGAVGLLDLRRELEGLRGQPPVLVTHAGTTDSGKKRDNNEDSFLTWQSNSLEDSPDGCRSQIRGLFAVCDGMGGHERGEVASQTAIAALRTHVLPILGEASPDFDLAERLRHVVKHEVNTAIWLRNGGDVDIPLRRMGTTVVMAALVDDRAYWVHVGDSRVYLLTESRGIEQLTDDHNVGTRDVKMGVATMLEAFRSPVGKHLTQALGPRNSEFVHPDTGVLILDEPCALLLCSDGLPDMVPEADMLSTILANWNDVGAAGAELVRLANHGGGLDNITSVIVRIDPGPKLFPAAVPQARSGLLVQ